MKYADFTKKVAEEANVSKKATREVLAAYAKVLKEILSEGDEVIHPSLFKAYITDAPAREYSNFDGEIKMTEPTIRIHFRPTGTCKVNVKELYNE